MRYSCNVCGEGGEYETLTLDCPLFTAARIVLDDWQVGGRANVHHFQSLYDNV